MDDISTAEQEPEKITFSWLISHQATKFVGPLSFRVRFICYGENGAPSYAWHTAIYQGITIANGIDNGEIIVEEYADVLNAWKLELEANQIKSLVQTQEADGDDGENVWTATFGDGRTSELKVKNGSRGPTGLIGSIETITGEPLHFFWGTKEAYNALSEEVKSCNLFAIITDDDTKDRLFTELEIVKQYVSGLSTGTTSVPLADSAAHAQTAGSAQTAGHAETAGSAETADQAVKDNQGNPFVTTYARLSDFSLYEDGGTRYVDAPIGSILTLSLPKGTWLDCALGKIVNGADTLVIGIETIDGRTTLTNTSCRFGNASESEAVLTGGWALCGYAGATYRLDSEASSEGYYYYGLTEISSQYIIQRVY